MMRALTDLFTYLSHELGDKFVPSEWKMRFRDTPLQANNSRDCGIHICTFAMCLIYNWLPNFGQGVQDAAGASMLAHTIWRKRQRITAELMNEVFTGVFGYCFPNPYPALPIDAIGFHQVWNRVIRTLPDRVQRRRADLVDMTKAQLTTFCKQEPGIGVAQNAHPAWVSWKKPRRNVFLQNAEQRLHDRDIADAEIVG